MLNGLQHVYSHPTFFLLAILTRKVGHTDLVFSMRSEFISRICVKDYKSLCAAAMLCANMVNIQIHTDTDSI